MVTVGSILHHARENGWKGYTTNADDEFEPIGNMGTATGSLLERSSDIRREDLARARAGALNKGLLHPGDAAVMYGESRGGKSFVALFLAYCIALGKLVLGRKVKRAPVLYIALEGVRGFRERMVAATEAYGDPGDWFARLVVPVLLSKGDEGAKGMPTVIEAAKQLAADCGQSVGLIIVDTYARATAGDDENSTADAMAYAEKRAAEIARQTGAAVMTIMHTNRAGDLRGSLHSRNAADLIIRIERSGEGEDITRKAIGEKVKDGQEAPLFDFTLRPVPLGDDPDGDAFGSQVIEPMPPKPKDSDKQKIVGQAYETVAERLGRDDVPVDDVYAEFRTINEPNIAKAVEKRQHKDDDAKERYTARARINAWQDAKTRLPEGLQLVEREGVKVIGKVAAKAPRGKTSADDEFEPIPRDLRNV
jgi:AAA domain